jgi:hypothetical protein
MRISDQSGAAMPRPKLDKKMRSVSATVAEPVYEQLVALSSAEDRSIARIIRRALGQFIENHSKGANPDLSARRRQRA